MTKKRAAALCIMAFLVSGVVWGQEDLNFRVAPYFGFGNISSTVENDYYEVDIDQEDVVFGFDVFIEKQRSNPNLFVGVDIGFQIMDEPETEIDGVEVTDDPDTTISNLFIGPSLRYFFNEKVYFLGTVGLSVMWSSGDDDIMETALFGPGFSLGVGYDIPSSSDTQFGLFFRLLFNMGFGEADEVDGYDVDVDWSASYVTPAFGLSIMF